MTATKHGKIYLSIVVVLIAIIVAIITNNTYSFKVRQVLYRTRDVLISKALKLALHQLDSKVQPNQPVEWSFPIKKKHKSTSDEENKIDSRPNIIFIVADDLGYNDLYGSRSPVTKNIRKIGDDGVRFTKAYSGHATCAPSRASMISGRFPTRFGYEFTPVHNIMTKILGRAKFFDIDSSSNTSHLADPILHKPTGKLLHVDDMAVPTDVPVVSEVLHDSGYNTIFIGKWHLGASNGTRPWERGYEQTLYFIQAASQYFSSGNKSGIPAYINDFIDDMMWDYIPFQIAKDNGPNFRPNEYITDYISKQAVEAIKATRSRSSEERSPFFLHLCYNAPHTPLHALDSDYFDPALDHIINHRERVYVAMIKAIDRGVEQIMRAVRKLGEEDNTMVIFTSDNGGANYIKLMEMNTPFRGGKGSFFEGGLRVPLLMKWPQKIAANTVHTETVGHVDIFSTLISAADVSRESVSHIPLDGVDLFKILSERKVEEDSHASLTMSLTTHVRPPIFWRSGHYRCLIFGDWKLSVAARPHKAWLYNLAKDPTEIYNLAPMNIEPNSESFKVINFDDLLVDLSPSTGPHTYPSPESLVNKVQNAMSTDLSFRPNSASIYTPHTAEIYYLLYSYLFHLDAQQSEPLWPGLSETPVIVDLENLVRQDYYRSMNNTNTSSYSESVVWTKEKFATMKPNIHSYSTLHEVLFRPERPIYDLPNIDANTEIILWPN